MFFRRSIIVECFSKNRRDYRSVMKKRAHNPCCLVQVPRPYVWCTVITAQPPRLSAHPDRLTCAAHAPKTKRHLFCSIRGQRGEMREPTRVFATLASYYRLLFSTPATYYHRCRKQDRARGGRSDALFSIGHLSHHITTDPSRPAGAI